MMVTTTTDKAITIWERKIGDAWAHNHIEDGHSFWDHPKPRCAYQANCWAGVQWRRTYGYLDDGNVVIRDLARETATC